MPTLDRVGLQHGSADGSSLLSQQRQLTYGRMCILTITWTVSETLSCDTQKDDVSDSVPFALRPSALLTDRLSYQSCMCPVFIMHVLFGASC